MSNSPSDDKRPQKTWQMIHKKGFLLCCVHFMGVVVLEEALFELSMPTDVELMQRQDML